MRQSVLQKKQMFCFLQGQGRSKGFCNQNMTVFMISSILVICLQQTWFDGVLSQVHFKVGVAFEKTGLLSFSSGFVYILCKQARWFLLNVCLNSDVLPYLLCATHVLV